MSDSIACYWWRDKPNFGDALGPLLVAHFTGRQPVWSDQPGRLLTVGSIVTRALSGDIVWGSGVHDLAKPCTWSPAGVTFLAVRGPISREFIETRGGYCPPIYGDPALLLPQLYSPPCQPIRKLAAMPHLGDEAGRKFAAANQIPLLDPRWPWQRVIAGILASERLITSSLHGLIAAEAYGVPVTWAAFTQSPEKFHDYYLGVGRPFPEPLPWPVAIGYRPPASAPQAAPPELLPALLAHFRTSSRAS